MERKWRTKRPEKQTYLKMEGKVYVLLSVSNGTGNVHLEINYSVAV